MSFGNQVRLKHCIVLIVTSCLVVSLLTYCSEKKRLAEAKTTPVNKTQITDSKIVRVEGTNIFNNDNVVFKGRTDTQSFTLRIRGESKSKVSFVLEKNELDTTRKLYFGELYSSRGGHLPLRFQTKVDEVRLSGEHMTIRLEEDHHRYARFSKCDTILFVREGAKEPFRTYINDLLARLNYYSKKIESRTNLENFQQLQVDLIEAIQFIEEVNGYDVKNDPYLYNAAKTLKLDSLIGILPANQIEEYVPNTIKPVIYKDFDGTLVGEIKRGSNNPLFEKIMFDNENHELKSIGYFYIRGSKNSFQNLGSYAIASMYLGESQEISIWKPVGDSLEMVTILNGHFGDYMSTTDFDTLITIDENSNLFVGTTSSGDGGLFGGELWVGLWQGGMTLDNLYSKEYGGDDTYSTYLEYELVDDSMLIVSTRVKKLDKKFEYVDSLLSLEKVNLIDLLNQIGS